MPGDPRQLSVATHLRHVIGERLVAMNAEQLAQVLDFMLVKRNQERARAARVELLEQLSEGGSFLGLPLDAFTAADLREISKSEA